MTAAPSETLHQQQQIKRMFRVHGKSNNFFPRESRIIMQNFNWNSEWQTRATNLIRVPVFATEYAWSYKQQSENKIIKWKKW